MPGLCPCPAISSPFPPHWASLGRCPGPTAATLMAFLESVSCQEEKRGSCVWLGPQFPAPLDDQRAQFRPLIALPAGNRRPESAEASESQAWMVGWAGALLPSLSPQPTICSLEHLLLSYFFKKRSTGKKKKQIGEKNNVKG